MQFPQGRQSADDLLRTQVCPSPGRPREVLHHTQNLHRHAPSAVREQRRPRRDPSNWCSAITVRLSFDSRIQKFRGPREGRALRQLVYLGSVVVSGLKQRFRKEKRFAKRAVHHPDIVVKRARRPSPEGGVSGEKSRPASIVAGGRQWSQWDDVVGRGADRRTAMSTDVRAPAGRIGPGGPTLSLRLLRRPRPWSRPGPGPAGGPGIDGKGP